MLMTNNVDISTTTQMCAHTRVHAHTRAQTHVHTRPPSNAPPDQAPCFDNCSAVSCVGFAKAAHIQDSKIESGLGGVSDKPPCPRALLLQRKEAASRQLLRPLLSHAIPPFPGRVSPEASLPPLASLCSEVFCLEMAVSLGWVGDSTTPDCRCSPFLFCFEFWVPES